MRYFQKVASKISKFAALGLCLTLLAALAACSPKVIDAPEPLPPLQVAVAPFSQPVQITELLAGTLPAEQGRASQANFQELDALMAQKLGQTARSYTYLPQSDLPAALLEDADGRRSALATWATIAKNNDAEIIIVPQIIDWRPRVGGSLGVVSPASLTVDFFLIDSRMEGSLVQRSHFSVTQEALAENLLTLGDFIYRKGRWVTAMELCGEAIDKAIKEFGL